MISDMTETPITTEEWREYHYADSASYRVTKPVRLWRKKDADGDSHRVLDADGVTHCPKRGWLAISWKAPGEPVSF